MYPHWYEYMYVKHILKKAWGVMILWYSCTIGNFIFHLAILKKESLMNMFIITYWFLSANADMNKFVFQKF